MKKIICIRHGRYGYSGALNQTGAEQSEKLAKILKEMANGQTVKILSSSLLRSWQTAKIIAQELGVEAEKYDPLQTDGWDEEVLQQCVDKIMSEGEKADIVMVVAHRRTTSLIPRKIAKGLGMRELFETAYYSTAHIVDIENKTVLKNFCA